MKLASAVLGLSLVICATNAHAATGLTVDDLLAFERISEPVASPDGKWIAYTLRTTDMAANRGRTDIWLQAVAGGPARRLTTHEANDTSPAWSADGAWIYFLSTRSGQSQVWRMSPSGGEAESVTKLPLDVGGFKLMPDGQRLIVTMDVWPHARSLADSVKKDAELADIKSSARVYDSLLFRHWDTWEDGRFAHLFLWTPPALGGKADTALDLTPGNATDTPTHPFGGMEEVALSNDGKALAYVMRTAGKGNAWSTNTDVFWVATDGRGKPKNLTAPNPGYDLSPTLSPDGKTLAVLSMVRGGYEADRQRVRLIDLASGKVRTIAENWDRSPSALRWRPDGAALYAIADHLGQQAIFEIDAAQGAVKPLIEQGHNDLPLPMGERLVFLRDTLSQPAELFTSARDGKALAQLSHHNDARVGKIAWSQAEQFTFKGAKNETVYGYVLRPATVKSGQKVPVAQIIHGGPQGSMGNHFHYRWNPEVYAGHGYGVVFIDFHGSTGYGQAFTDAINGDWGGAPFEDNMKGLDAALAKYPWLDGKRAVALGASYGGYMINWINGHTDRYRALVCHAGNLDERMAYYDTEELWFPEWEHGGLPWVKPEGYTKHNPIDFVSQWKTPTLVTHGALDFRVVETQGMSTFTALQRKGIASKFMVFPDENHWILKPHNSKHWHQEVLAWLDRFTR